MFRAFNKYDVKRAQQNSVLLVILFSGLLLPDISYAEFKDWEIAGYIENQTRNRFNGSGLSKSRNTLQVEAHRNWGRVGIFRNFSFNGTIRAEYDAVYDLNDDDFGDDAGGQVFVDGGIFGAPVAYGASPISLPGMGGRFITAAGANNTGLVPLGSAIHNNNTRGPGLQLSVPVRPCDEDPRGCIDGYLDFDKQDLASPQFNDRADVIREAYFSGTIPLNNGDQIDISLGRQQVVWGRTDLFRVLDVINPVDFSRNNIYDELEDIRIPMGILTAEYRWGATKTFDDINLQFLWKWEQFRPNNLGQGGSPNAILDAGSFFRAFNNCWVNGCTVGNFNVGTQASPVLAPVNFGPGVLGIRQANLPDWEVAETDIGARLEGVFKSVGFSLNAYYFRSTLPSLRGNIQSTDPFTGTVADHPFLVAFDIDFPRIGLIGGSADFYVEKLTSAFRVEVAWTTGEEFANTAVPDLFSESDVIRYVIGWDRPTFIRFLNNDRAFLLSAQLFGQHILDHESQQTAFGTIGIPDFEHSWIGTFLFKGFYKNDLVSPQILSAYDFRSQSLVTEPSIDWLISDNWRLTVGASLKFGGAESFDDNRSAAPFAAVGGPAASVASLSGAEPLGRFRAGPIGQSHNEDAVFATIRFRF